MTTATMSPLRRRMVEDMQIRGLEATTQASYIRAIEAFAGFLGHSPDSATPAELRAWQLHMARAQVSIPVYNHRITVLRFFFSVIGVEVSASGDVRPRIGPNLRLALGGRLHAREYFSGGDFDDRSATLRVGPIYAHGRGEVGVFGLATRRWFAHEPYSTTLGGRAFGDYDVTSRFRVAGGVTLLDIDLDNGTRLDGQYYGIDARLSYTFDDRSIGRVFGGWAVNDRNDPGESYDYYRFGIGYSRELPLGLIAYVAPEVRFRNYHGQPSLFEEDRDDIMYRIESRLILRQLIIRDFAPFVTFAYEANDSSIDFFGYDRLRGSIGFTKRF